MLVPAYDPRPFYHRGAPAVDVKARKTVTVGGYIMGKVHVGNVEGYEVGVVGKKRMLCWRGRGEALTSPT